MNETSTLLDNAAQMRDYQENDRLEEEAKKNHDFVQFTRRGLHKLSKVKNGLALQIFLFISKEMDKENKLIVSQQTLAEYFAVSRSTVAVAIKELFDSELIYLLKIGKQNIYCLNANVVWTRERDKLHLARFRASVIVSQEEQVKIKKMNMKQISMDLED